MRLGKNYNPSIGRFTQRDSYAGRRSDPLSLNLYTYCHNNPIRFMDFNGHERIVVSGGIDGEEAFKYQFIETALKQIGSWKSQDFLQGEFDKENDITWIVANWNYNDMDLRKYQITALDKGINLMVIDDKEELFDYINKDGRDEDLIEAITFFAHGTAFDAPGVSDPGYGYAVALGYGGSGKHNNALNIFSSDLSKIKSSSFANSSSSVFYSCRTGNKFNNTIFAQEWANVTGSTTRAASGKGILSGRTDYTNIYENPLPLMDTICSIFGKRSPRQKARYTFGYSSSGSLNYPEVNDGGKMKTFYPN